ncbi:autotransporter domain-containing protein [Chitinimonas koreensis]|uniref:autotransporter domain-containing protein n=1 Tax=Chitinimonas koreensis TaxID=356302 RepID=UPI00040B711C|nr:autotransporter domain-containing protein [Chitinimonas koreensis]QNM96120.1 autotransporter domain-containing protein [Chitinimonas koreensis]
MKRFGLVRPTLAAAAVAIALSGAASAAGQYSNAYFFGDSLTDIGAFGGVAGLPQGARWTVDNADIYATLLAKKYGIQIKAANTANAALAAGGSDFAQGGARATEVTNAGPGGLEIRDLPTQVADFLARSGGKADPNAIYSLWVGGNDIPVALAAAQTGGSAAGQAVVGAAVASTVAQVQKLRAAGAKRIIVNNLPDFGATPSVMQSAIGLVVQGALPQVGSNLTAFGSSAQVQGLLASVPGTVATGVGAQVGSGVAAQTSATLAQNVQASLTPALGAATAAAVASGFQTAFNTAWSGSLSTQLTANLNTGMASLNLPASVGGVLNTTVTNLNSAGTIGGVTGQAVVAANAQVNAGGQNATANGLNAARQAIVNAVAGQLATLQTNVGNTLQSQIGGNLSANAGAATIGAINATYVNAVNAAVDAVVAANPALAAVGPTLKAQLAAAQSQVVTNVSAALPTIMGQVTPAVAAQLNATLASAFAAVSGSTQTLNDTLASQLSTTNASGAYLSVRSGATQLSGLFNTALAGGLVGQDVVVIDVQRFLNEVLANPTAFGFSNVAGQACPVGTSSLVCTSAQLAGSGYLFADDRHPTPQTHAVLAQYIGSVLDAPYYAAQLVNNQPAVVAAAQAAIDERGVRARSVNDVEVYTRVSRLDHDTEGGVDSLKSDAKNTAATVGVDNQFGAHSVVGVNFTQVKNDTDFANQAGSFSATNRAVAFYGRYDNGPISIGGDLVFGSTRFSDIERNITLGALKRVERADARGNQVGLRVVGGYTLSFGSASVTPTVSLAFRENKISGYSEKCGDVANASFCSTSMRYGTQRVDSLLAGAGARAEVKLGKVTPFGSVMVYRDSKDKDRTVEAGLVGQPTTFETSVFTPDPSYAVLNVGARAEFAPGVSGYLSYSHTAGIKDEKRRSIALGLQAGF